MIFRLIWWSAAAVGALGFALAIINDNPWKLLFYVPMLALAILVLASKDTGWR